MKGMTTTLDCPHVSASGGYCDGCGRPECWCWFPDPALAPCPIHNAAASSATEEADDANG